MIIDSNVWIFSQVDAYPENESAKLLVQNALTSGVAFTNDIIISETFHKLSRLIGQSKAKTTAQIMLNSDRLFYIPIEKDTLESALELCSKYAMRINDALIAQQCIENKMPILTDNVKDFKKIPVLKIRAFRVPG